MATIEQLFVFADIVLLFEFIVTKGIAWTDSLNNIASNSENLFPEAQLLFFIDIVALTWLYTGER